MRITLLFQVSGNLIGYVIFKFGDSDNLPISPKKIFLLVLIFSGVVGVLALQGLPANGNSTSVMCVCVCPSSDHYGRLHLKLSHILADYV